MLSLRMNLPGDLLQTEIKDADCFLLILVRDVSLVLTRSLKTSPNADFLHQKTESYHAAKSDCGDIGKTGQSLDSRSISRPLSPASVVLP